MKFATKFNLRVVPRSNRNELKEQDGKFKLYIKAVPEKGRANREIVRFFKKKCNLKVEIVSGEKSKDKILRVIV